MILAEVVATRFLQSRWCNLLLMILALTTCFVTERTHPLALTLIDRGPLFDSPSMWVTSASLSQYIAMALNIGVVMVMVYINRRFNLLRTVSLIFVAMFLIMEVATPAAMMWFSGGQLCALLIMWCMAIMFTAYNKSKRNKRIFLVFVILSAASLTQYGFVIYIPVFLLGCAQMRVLSFRTLIATILGLVTPLWIVFGLGLASPDDLHLPQLINPFNQLDTTLSVQLFATLLLTLLTGFVTGLLNTLKVMSMNARMRAYNGLLSTIGIITGIMAVLDFTNVEFYIPLLNACTAIQIGMFCRFNADLRAYIVEIILILAYIALWVWGLFL